MGVLKSAMVSAAAMSLAVVPTLAQAAPASKLSLAPAARTSTVSKGDKAAGGGIIIAVLAAAAVIAGIVIIADSNDNADSN